MPVPPEGFQPIFTSPVVTGAAWKASFVLRSPLLTISQQKFLENELTYKFLESRAEVMFTGGNSTYGLCQTIGTGLFQHITHCPGFESIENIGPAIVHR